jgi:hypothetical protein
MKNILRFAVHIALFFLILFISCQKPVNNDDGGGNLPGNTLNPSTPSPVTATVSGLVVNENGVPVSGASVKSGPNSTTTDSRGYFTFKNIGLDAFAANVNVNMSGYFTAYRNFSGRTDGVHFIKIKLIRKIITGTIAATGGGSVILANGSEVTLQPASVIIKSTGLPYAGTINVYTSYIDPTAADISSVVPGSFMGIDAANQRTLLQSFGMLAVDIEGTSGEALQIATNKTAKLKFAIPATLIAKAPATIAMWSINETTGVWQEEKTATKNGNFYEGDVSHFSFWNCDYPTYTVKIQMTLKTPAGIPLRNSLVRITRLNGNGAGYGYTDSLGWVGGIVPQNENLKLEVLTSCNDISYSQNIGPYTADVNLGDIIITPDAPTTVTITGTVNNCAGQPVTNGYVQAYFDYTSYNAPVNNGQFTITFTRCSNSTATVSVVATDITNNQQGSATTYNVSSGSVNTGTISACGISTLQFIDYTLDGTPFTFSSSNIADTITTSGSGNQGLNINGNKKTFQINPSINLNLQTANAVGTFPLTYLRVNQYDSITIIAPFNINITQFGPVGQYVEGNGSGSFKDFFNVTHTLSCTFRVRRQN